MIIYLVSVNKMIIPSTPGETGTFLKKHSESKAPPLLQRTLDP